MAHAARGGGRWQSSGGFRSKFGLTVGEMLRGLEELKALGMARAGAGDLKGAAKAYEKTVKLAPDNIPPVFLSRYARASRVDGRL